MNVGKMEKSPWYMGRTKETVQYPNRGLHRTSNRPFIGRERYDSP